jgi:transcriptional regulator with GAF, ATPase, and Fis domain
VLKAKNLMDVHSFACFKYFSWLPGDQMTMSIKEAVAEFNERLLASAWRMNLESSRGMRIEIETALKDLAEILGADHFSLCTKSPPGDNWETVLDHPVAGASEPLGDLAPRKLSFVQKLIGERDFLVLNHLPGDPSRKRSAVCGRTLVGPAGQDSILVFPVKTDGGNAYLLSFFFVRKSCPVPPPVVPALQPAVGFIASAYDSSRSALENEELTCFEDLLGEISSTYVNIPVDDIDRAVTQDLKRLCKLMNADRYSILILKHSEKENTELLYSYTAKHENNPEQFEAGDAWVMEHGGHNLFRCINEICLRGKHHAFSDVEELPDNEKLVKEAMYRMGVKSQLAVPVSANGEVIGLMIIFVARTPRQWRGGLIQKIRQFGDLFASAYARKRFEEARRKAHGEITRLKARLESDFRYLNSEFEKTVGGKIIVGDSRAMNRVMEQVMQVAPTTTPVLLLGETGVGKGILAQSLHQASRLGERPLVQLNCATLAPGLVESELFGHERGAFTGADRQRSGRFEIAEGTTLFLDEIGEMPLELQAKLLRVLETGEYERLGGTKTRKTDARIIAATNRDLEAEVVAGRFRKDLWYRLSIFPIRIPPLRERMEDIPAIVDGFMEKFSRLSGKHFAPIAESVMDDLKRHPWPGNVRELRNIIERAVIVSDGDALCVTMPNRPLNVEGPEPQGDLRPLVEIERLHILRVLKKAAWRIEGAGGAADILGFNPSTLRSRMRKLGIRRPAPRSG